MRYVVVNQRRTPNPMVTPSAATDHIELPVAEPNTTAPISNGICRSTSCTGCTNNIRGLSRCHTRSVGR